MDRVFEVKYLAIKWRNKDTPLKVTESLLSLPLEKSENYYSVELQAYKRIETSLDAQVAFRILDVNSNIEPYFIDASNNKQKLFKIVDPLTNKSWWIENGKWKGKYRESPLWNHVGLAKIIFGNTICHLDISANSFTKGQLNDYLNDFQNDFWYLIFKPNSLTRGEAKNKDIKLLNDDSMSIIKKFTKYALDVLKNPKKELKEIQGIKDIKEVRPVIKTFTEIATSGIKRKHASRDTIESYNVAENKYIHYALQRVYTILLYIQNASTHMEEFYNKGCKFHDKRLNNFSNIITINKNIFKNEIINLKLKIENEKELIKTTLAKQDMSLIQNLEEEVAKQTDILSLIAQAIQNQVQSTYSQNSPNCFIIKLEKRANDYGNKIQFWGKIKGCGADSWDDFGINNSFSLAFNREYFNFLKIGQEYKIVAENKYRKTDTARGTIHNIYFTYISSMDLINIENKSEEIEYKIIYVKLNSKQDDFNNNICFWGKAKYDVNDNWGTLSNKDSLSIEFNQSIFDTILNEWSEYKISAYIRRSKFQKSNGGVIHKVYFEYITNMERLNYSYINELNTLETQIPTLEANSWQRELSDREKYVQEQEKRALEESIKQLENHKKASQDLSKKLQPLINQIKKLLNKCIYLKIEQNSFFPNSMTFVQNPDYQGVHKFFNKIKDFTGIDKSLFTQLQIIEKIGIVEIPTLYERWSLLQIIKILIDKYNYTPEENWKLKLSAQMIEDITKIRDIEIKFINNNVEKEIILKYEYTLPIGKNGIRPDFILDIKSLSTGNTHRLIMDSKFHENVDIEQQIEELYFKKNYAQDFNNTVFILHPDLNAIKHQRTPTHWGNNSFYGETDLFLFSKDKDKYPNHKYGAILLSPFNKQGDFLDNLQRVIGMSLQYNMEDNVSIIDDETKSINPMPKEKIFCLVCGSANCTISKPIRASNYASNRWLYNIDCQEKNCQHSFSYNYCWNCKHRLVKNGRYWTYHSLQILNEFDVKCPNCNKLLSELPKERH